MKLCRDHLCARKNQLTSGHLRAYWRGDRSLQSRAAYADYCRERYLARAKGESNLVPINRARQLLLQFESGCDAARVVRLNQATVHRILTRKVKKIRIATETQIILMADVRKGNVLALGRVA